MFRLKKGFQKVVHHLLAVSECTLQYFIWGQPNNNGLRDGIRRPRHFNACFRLESICFHDFPVAYFDFELKRNKQENATKLREPRDQELLNQFYSSSSRSSSLAYNPPASFTSTHPPQYEIQDLHLHPHALTIKVSV